jgi:hypothetical protein
VCRVRNSEKLELRSVQLSNGYVFGSGRAWLLSIIDYIFLFLGLISSF